jgi:hypothetical protein
MTSSAILCELLAKSNEAAAFIVMCKWHGREISVSGEDTVGSAVLQCRALL